MSINTDTAPLLPVQASKYGQLPVTKKDHKIRLWTLEKNGLLSRHTLTKEFGIILTTLGLIFGGITYFKRDIVGFMLTGLSAGSGISLLFYHYLHQCPCIKKQDEQIIANLESQIAIAERHKH